MSTTYIPHSVTLAEVAKATKRTTNEIQDECERDAKPSGLIGRALDVLAGAPR